MPPSSLAPQRAGEVDRRPRTSIRGRRNGGGRKAAATSAPAPAPLPPYGCAGWSPFPASRGRRRGLQKAVRIHVDREPDRAGDLHPRAPGAEEGLQVDVAVGADQEALAPAGANQGEGGGGRAP